MFLVHCCRGLSAHRISKVLTDLCELIGVVIEGHRFDNCPGTTFGISALKDTAADKDCLGAELHHECRIRRRSYTSRRKVGNRQRSAASYFEDKVIWCSKVAGHTHEFFLRQCGDPADFVYYCAQMPNGLNNVPGTGFTLRANHRRTFTDAAERFTEITASAYKRNLERLLVDVELIVGRGKHFAFIYEIHTKTLQDLCLNEVSNSAFGHDGDRNGILNTFDHAWIAHSSDAAVGANVGWNSLKRHDRLSARIRRDFRFFRVNHVHNDAALEHFCEADLRSPIAALSFRPARSVHVFSSSSYVVGMGGKLSPRLHLGQCLFSVIYAAAVLRGIALDEPGRVLHVDTAIVAVGLRCVTAGGRADGTAVVEVPPRGKLGSVSNTVQEDSIRQRYAGVCEQVSNACRRVHRDPDDVEIMVITKTRSAAEIREVMAAGARSFGENRVQEITSKWSARSQANEAALILSPDMPAGVHVPERNSVRLSLVGHLQSNKVRKVVDRVDAVASIDKIETVDALAKRAVLPLDVLVQINTSGEASKFGMSEDETAISGVIEQLLGHKNLRARGVMTIAPFIEDRDAIRTSFVALRRWFEWIGERYSPDHWDTLSMGMSGDLEIAIEEGSTQVRPGTAVFGPRPA